MNANSDREYIDNKLGDVRTAVDDLRVVMNERSEATRTAIDDLRLTMNERFTAIHARFDAFDVKIDSAVAKGVSEMIKWVVGLFVTLIVVVVGLSSVVMNLVLRQPAPVAVTAPAPAPVISTPAVIIQLSPQGATITPAVPAGGKP
ncbi:hypothetical protein GJ699_24395 [Duganella sp. FT80W]|uniref:Uncharacterized protein n=1 Tax=Duganella guangzhouensis TaxID=2666084 RepID=A0A6I2L8G5_9BURK|nr:hypothetical protein [Duganella guangzhouensis]MRW93144.1 hypothetical protein [Duganella guangzhouensis]